MICDFWLTDDQLARLAPLLPSDTRGKPRLGQRRGCGGNPREEEGVGDGMSGL